MKIQVGSPDIQEKEKEYVRAVIDSGWITMGKMVRAFEKKFAKYIGTSEGIAVSSGTDADLLALATLLASGAAKPGDEVILPALTFVATANAVHHAGLKPVFVDVDPETYCLDPAKIEAAITKRTRAILPVHLFGHPVDMDPVVKIAKKHNLKIIEDAAEAHGSEYKGKKVGSIGDMSAFSFYVAHTITCGEGGIVLTNDEEYAEILRSLRAHGRSCTCKECVLLTTKEGRCKKRLEENGQIDRRFQFLYKGYSAKMNELEAAIGLAQLERLDAIMEARRRNMALYNKRLEGLRDVLQLPAEKKYAKVCPLGYTIIVKDDAPFSKGELVTYLEDKGIETRPMFGSVPTQQLAYADFGCKLGDFPVSEKIGKDGFYVGCHQKLSEADIGFVCDSIRTFIEKHK